jgi:opacity protein-like surface antigen
MMHRRQVIVLGAAALLWASSARAADVTGVWKGEVTLPSGQKLPFVARLTQNGATVTGKLDGIGGAPDVEVVDGKADGDIVTFSGVRQIAGAAVRFNYTARAVDANTLDFTIVREDGAQAPLKCLTTRAAD